MGREWRPRPWRGARRSIRADVSVLVFLGLVVVYLAIIQGGGRIASAAIDDAGHGKFTTSEEVLYGLLIPVGLSLIFVYGVVAVLGWWRPVFVDGRPVQRWVPVVPIAFAVTILVGINVLAPRSQGHDML